MASTSEQHFESIVRRTREAIPAYRAPPSLQQITDPDGDSRLLFIIGCADSRVDPSTILHLKPGEAVVYKNAGGRITDDFFRSLTIMGSVRAPGIIVVLHHTDCGGLFRTGDTIREIWARRRPEHADKLPSGDFGTYKHLGIEACLREDVEKVQAWPHLPKDVPVHGYVFEVETGKVERLI